jgi:hypothetical protein
MRRPRLPALVVIAGAAVYLLLGRGRWVHDATDQSNWFTDIEGVLRGGRVLHEVRIHFGPLSIWVLSAACRIFGARVGVVAAVQLAVAVAAALLLLRLAGNFLDSREQCAAAAVAVIWILWMPGEANIFFPSTFANSQGILLALASLALAVAAFRRRSVTGAAAAGMVAGLACLTKQEMGAVAALGILAVACFGPDLRLRARAGLLACAGAAAIATSGGALLAALSGEPFALMAKRNYLWPFVPVAPALNHLFHRFQAWDRVWEVPIDAADSLLWIGVIGGAVWLVLYGWRHSRRPAMGVAALLLAGAAALWFRWTAGARFSPLTLCAPALLPAVFVAWKRSRRNPRMAWGAAVAAGLAAASLLLLWRVGYRGLPDRVYSAYGYFFALAPLTLLGSVVARRATAIGGGLRSGPAIVVGSLAVLYFGSARIAALEEEWQKRVPLRTERGTIWVYREWGEPLNDLKLRLLMATRSGDPVFFVPGPKMLDFLLDRPHACFYPGIIGELDPEPERELIALWERVPPRAVVWFDQPIFFYSKNIFGRDYGVDAMRWVESRYTLVASRPRGNGVGFKLYLPKPRSGETK